LYGLRRILQFPVQKDLNPNEPINQKALGITHYIFEIFYDLRTQ
jgi:hypothetical protein